MHLKKRLSLRNYVSIQFNISKHRINATKLQKHKQIPSSDKKKKNKKRNTCQVTNFKKRNRKL